MCRGSEVSEKRTLRALYWSGNIALGIEAEWPRRAAARCVAREPDPQSGERLQ